MNPKSFLGMMSDISDEYIVSAANPHSKPIRWYQVSAIAACIVLLMAAAIYPKLRMQTPPVIDRSVYTETTIATTAITTATGNVILTETHTVAPQTRTTAGSVSATMRTTVAETETIAMTAPQMTELLIDEAKSKQSTSETIATEEIMSDNIQVPLCRTEVVIKTYPTEECYIDEEESQFECHFFEPTEVDIAEFETLPADIDRSGYIFVCVSISKCENAAITGGSITDGQCILNIIWLNEEDIDTEPRKVKYLLVFPAACNISAKDMQAAFTAISDRSLFQSQMEAASEFITIQS